jgi:hypothetical protein
MYKTILVKELVQEGEELIKRLESRRFQIAAAFWYYFEDLMRWRLVIVFSSLVDREGPLRAYMHIQEALGQMEAKELLVSDISVMRPSGYEFEELRSAVERSGRAAGRRPMSTPRDIVFERAYVYRWSDQWSKSYRT